MKRLLIALLAMLLLTTVANAETLDRGLWHLEYDPAVVNYMTNGELDGFRLISDDRASMLIVTTDAAPSDAAGMMDEAIGGYEGSVSVMGPAYETLESGVQIGYMQAVHTDGQVETFVVATGTNGLLCITLTIPSVNDYDSLMTLRSVLNTLVIY